MWKIELDTLDPPVTDSAGTIIKYVLMAPTKISKLRGDFNTGDRVKITGTTTKSLKDAPGRLLDFNKGKGVWKIKLEKEVTII
jgi:hypothetical protein